MRPSSSSTMPTSMPLSMAPSFRNFATSATCVCANRIYAQEGTGEASMKRLSTKVAALRVSDGLEANID